MTSDFRILRVWITGRMGYFVRATRDIYHLRLVRLLLNSTTEF